jgi:hypothetical protein
LCEVFSVSANARVRRFAIKSRNSFKNTPKANYDASSLEVLKGLDPVRRRPGMYTDTSRPNHLAQEVIDNAVDEAIAGFAKRINVIYHDMMAEACPSTYIPVKS